MGPSKWDHGGKHAACANTPPAAKICMSTSGNTTLSVFVHADIGVQATTPLTVIRKVEFALRGTSMKWIKIVIHGSCDILDGEQHQYLANAYQL